MRILVLVAGSNEPSNSNVLADHFIEGMKELPGISFEKIRLRELSIADFSLKCYEQDFQPEADFWRLQTLVEDAHGLVIATPVWNFGVPGHLKNLIDRFGAFGLDRQTRTQGQWKGKPVYLIYTGGAPFAAWTGLQRRTTSFVPTALQYFGGSHVGTHYEPRCMVSKGVFGLVVDKRPESLTAIHSKGKKFAEIVKKYEETGALPIGRTFMRALYRIGQKIQQKFV